jgi:hypothetical protein
MGHMHFDDLTRELTVPSRRAVLAILGMGVLGAMFGRDPAEETVAQRRRQQAHDEKKKKRNRKKKKPSPPPSPPPPPATRCNTIGGEVSCIEPIFELEDCCDIFLGEVCTACGCCLESDSCCGETCCPSGQECCGGRDCCPTDYECCSGGECCHPSMTCCPDGSCHLVCR